MQHVKKLDNENQLLREVLAKCHHYADGQKMWDGTAWRYVHPAFKKIIEVTREALTAIEAL